MVLDNLKFWKKEGSSGQIEPPKPFSAGSDSMDSGMGSMADNDPFSPKDRTPGLGGTGSLDDPGSRPGFSGQSMENPEEGITLKGPSYERPETQGELRHSPLSPREPHATNAGALSGSRDIEIMSAKIDAIKANIESINHRLESIERMIASQEKNKRYSW